MQVPVPAGGKRIGTGHDVTGFSHALLREPSPSAVNGLRTVDRGAPDFTALKKEHDAYRATLHGLGIATILLPPLESLPDSLFVEDPALLLEQVAILLRPGAVSRRGEVEKIAPVLRRLFPRVIQLPEGFVEGGDVLVTPDTVLIGLSGRTDHTGAQALSNMLRALGRDARIVTPPAGTLHLKTACAMIGPRTVLATARLLAGLDCFANLERIAVADGEDAAANALAVNGTVLLAAGFPRTRQKLERAGFTVRTLRLDEMGKLDAGLSCMSLRWMAKTGKTAPAARLPIPDR